MVVIVVIQFMVVYIPVINEVDSLPTNNMDLLAHFAVCVPHHATSLVSDADFYWYRKPLASYWYFSSSNN